MNLTEEKVSKEVLSNSNSIKSSVLVVSDKKPEELMGHLQKKDVHCDFFQVETEGEKRNFNYKNMAPAIEYAMENDFSLVLGVDPNSNTLTVAVRRFPLGKFQILTSSQLAVILANEILLEEKENENRLVFLKALNVSDMFDSIVEKGGAKCNFFINETSLMNHLQEVEHDTTFAVTDNHEFFYNKGFNELIVKLLNLEEKLRQEDLTIFDKLLVLFREYGFYKEKTFNIDVEKGSQINLFKKAIDKLRKSPPEIIGSQPLRSIEDFEKKNFRNFLTGKKTKIELPPHNIFRLTLIDGTRITLSYTDSKISYQISISGLGVIDKETYNTVNSDYNKKIIWYMDLINKLSI